MKKFFILLAVLILSSFLSPPKILAKVLVWDDFSDGNAKDGTPTMWTEFAGPEGSWKVENGVYTGSVVKEGNLDTFSYSLAGNNSITNYSFSVKIKGLQGVDKKIMLRYQSNSTRYDVNLLQNSSINLQKWISGSSTNLWWGSGFNPSLDGWYTLQAVANGSNFKILVDNQTVIDINDEVSPILTGKIGLQVWPGFYNGYGSVTTTSYDDVLVCDFDGPCVIPAPTPALKPLILIPGIGASWNHEAMILGDENQVVEDWYMTPGVHVYDALIKSLENAGYKTGSLDKNLFVFNYDWRKTVEQISLDLKNFIANNFNTDEKLELVGHSM